MKNELKYINEIKFDERYDDEFTGETSFYFIFPKEYLDVFFPKKYSNAISCEINITIPTSELNTNIFSIDINKIANKANVSISPTRETSGGTEDYDWTDIEIPFNSLCELIKKGIISHYFSSWFEIISNAEAKQLWDSGFYDFLVLRSDLTDSYAFNYGDFNEFPDDCIFGIEKKTVS